MKILVLNDYWGPTAGGFVVAYNLAQECRRRGHQLAFITTVQRRAERGLTYEEGLPVYKIYTQYPLRFRGLFSIWNPSVFREFRRIVREVQPDIVHAHIIHMYLSHYVLKLVHDRQLPVVLTAHDTMTFCYTRLREPCSPDGTAQHQPKFWDCLRCQRFRYVPFRNACLRHYINTSVAKVISVSNALKIGLELNGMTNVQTVYNGIDPQQYVVSEQEVRAFRQKYQLEGQKVLLFAGRPSYAKGIDLLIRAMPQILKAHPNSRLLILSAHNTYTEYLCQLARELGVQASLVLPGWLNREELRRAYAACDVGVVPSIYFEPLATVCLELMAAGKPVVGTTVGGTPEMIVHGKTGYLVHPQNMTELAERIGYLFQHQEVARRFGEEGYQRVHAEFHLHKQCEQVLAIYLQAMGKVT